MLRASYWTHMYAYHASADACAFSRANCCSYPYSDGRAHGGTNALSDTSAHHRSYSISYATPL